MQDKPSDPAAHAVGKSEAQLPRFTRLDAFEPHRKTFECRHEADANPPITPEAEALFQQALALDNHDLWAEQRDYKKIAQLYEQAMKLGHWKVQFNLAGLFLQGKGVPQDTEKAIELTEDLMQKGVPAAWDNMGTMYMGGIGSLKQDATVAYAFWQRAADMGSMASQTYLGAKLIGVYDDPPSFWANRSISRKMLECAFAQGYGSAAYELGADLDGGDPLLGEDYGRALKVLHEGVKMGSEKSANKLSVAFDGGRPLVGRIGDSSRAARYSILGDALYTNPTLKFPNLDKVLPLPPAPLPKWDGDKKTLIDAAKAVVPVPPAPPKPEPSPASQRTGRAHIPEGYTLPEQPAMPVPAQYESTAAPASGYWLAKLMHPRSERQLQWNTEQVPLRYEQGELFDRTRPGLVPEDRRIQFHYLGQPVPVPPMPEIPANPRVAQGIAREASLPEPALQCPGHKPCPATGIWQARVADDHPLAATFNQWHRQGYVEQGQPFPDPRAQHLEADPASITWTWWNQANREGPVGITHVSTSNPRPGT